MRGRGCQRRVVGYAVSRHIDVRVTPAALQATIASRRPAVGCTQHSDRGSQCVVAAYRHLLVEHVFTRLRSLSDLLYNERQPPTNYARNIK
jgi:hypothetical protein